MPGSEDEIVVDKVDKDTYALTYKQSKWLFSAARLQVRLIGAHLQIETFRDTDTEVRRTNILQLY